MGDTQQQQGAPSFAYFFVASGGGVVGWDYATWLDVNPLVGAAIGGIISAIILGVCKELYSTRNEVKYGFMKAGGFLGAIFGAYIMAANSEGSFDWLVGAFVGGVLGAVAGEMAAAIILFAVCAVLFLSQGPIGLVLRTAILNSN